MEELYSEAIPPADYHELEEEEGKPSVYMQHFLDSESQEEIIETVLDDYSIPQDLYFEAKKSVLLSHGPSTSKANVNRARTSHGMKPINDILQGENE